MSFQELVFTQIKQNARIRFHMYDWIEYKCQEYGEIVSTSFVDRHRDHDMDPSIRDIIIGIIR